MSALATLMCALMTLGCQGEPQCVPGRSVACACVGGGEGAQTCAPSGRQYLACVCPDSPPQLTAEVSEVLPVSSRPNAPPLVEASPTPQPSPDSLERSASLNAKVMKGDDPLETPPLRLVSATAPLVDSTPSNSAPSNSAPSEQPSAAPRERDDSSIELEPIEIPRATTAGASQVKREWWLVLEGAQRCEPSDDINAPTHPAQLLAQGCYIKLKRDQRMRVKCDGPPHGPQSFQYTETKARCLELIKPKPRDLPDDFLARSSSSRDSRDSRASRASRAPRARSASQSGGGEQWHCLCYQEVFQGVASDSTACRKSMESCRDLEQKIEEGSPLLVKGSTSVRCKTYKAEEPWDLFGVRYQWLPSSQPGAWWSPRGCFLDPQAQRRRARTQRKRPARATPRAPQKRPSPPATQVSKTSSEPSAGRSCEQACWANLAEPSERAQRFKQRDVPTTLLWGAPYAKRVGAIMETCVTRNRSQGRSNYRRGCFQGSLKACTKICERDQ